MERDPQAMAKLIKGMGTSLNYMATDDALLDYMENLLMNVEIDDQPQDYKDGFRVAISEMAYYMREKLFNELVVTDLVLRRTSGAE